VGRRQIEALTPRQAGAELLIQQLGAALRARAGAVERAAGATTITVQQLEEEGSITEAGEQIDRVLQQCGKQDSWLMNSHTTNLDSP
jgi:hypothetical protein